MKVREHLRRVFCVFISSWLNPNMRKLSTVFLILAIAGTLYGQDSFNQKVDSIVKDVMEDTHVPSVSLAIVQEGKITYVQAYGNARLEPQLAAKPEMRYSIGSISKQFTATAILLLAEQKKLSLDDPVSKFAADLTRSKDVTIRQLLSHTSGYQDYWPQDYVPPFMLQEITSEKILDQWARKPLDFDPGTQWQYSNTNYVIAGLVVEKASGMPLWEFLSKNIFTPLAMTSATNIDQKALAEPDAAGYLRFGLGPLRPAPKEGKGWLFAAGELAMNTADLAKWDIAMMNQRLLTPASYNQMQREVLLKNGAGTGYGLGIFVRVQGGHRILEHDGEVSGYRAENRVYPDDHAAIIVFINQDATDATSEIGQKIEPLIFAGNEADLKANLARKIFEDLQHGKIDRSLFTSNGNSYFTDQAVQDFASSLAPLGSPKKVTQTSKRARGGMIGRHFSVECEKQKLDVWTYELPDGKLEQYQLQPAN